MATSEQIQEWKVEHKNVFRTVISGVEYYYHSLSRQVYMNILLKQALDPKNFDNDLEVFKACVISEHTEEDLQIKAGILAVLSEKIMISSGFEMTDVEEL